MARPPLFGAPQFTVTEYSGDSWFPVLNDDRLTDGAPGAVAFAAAAGTVAGSDHPVSPSDVIRRARI